MSRKCFNKITSTLPSFHGLNQTTIKCELNILLVPLAMEQLHSARIFTKLDPCSAYNHVHIREGDDWKMMFSTTSGHFKYCVIPYGISFLRYIIGPEGLWK